MYKEKRKKAVKYGFTTIQHEPRLKFDLSNDAYCIADAIYNLSNNPSSINPGWCYASRQSIANFFGISKRTVQRVIQELVEKKLIYVHNDTSNICTTQIWYEEFVEYKLTEMRGCDKLS